MSNEKVGAGEKVPNTFEARQQLERVREISAQMRTVAELHRTIKLLEGVVRENEADHVQTAPDGYVFLVSPFNKTRSWTYIEPNPSYSAGPNYTESPKDEAKYREHDLSNPFTAHQLVAAYFGVVAVNLEENLCIIMEEKLGQGQTVADIELTPVQ